MHETITGKLVAGNELVVDHVTAHLEFRKHQSTPLEPGKWRGSVKVSEEQAITFFQKGTCILVSDDGRFGTVLTREISILGDDVAVVRFMGSGPFTD